MRNFSLITFVMALFVIAFINPAAAEPKWGWGECDHSKTLSVENDEATDQSVAENPAPETPAPDKK